MNRLPHLRRLGPPVLTGLLLLSVWLGLKHGYALPPYLLPGPGEIARAAWAERATLGVAMGETLSGAAAGFTAAGLGGFLLALLLAPSARVRAAAYPWIVFFQMIPVIVLAPIFVIWLGPGWWSVVLIAFLIGFFPVVANTIQGLLSADANQVDLFRLYGARRWQELLLLRIPGALPYFFTGLQIAASLSVIGALTGEIFAGSSSGTGGLGFLIIIYKAQLKVPALFAAAFAACLLGFLFVGGVSLAKWLALRHWHESALPRES